MQIDMIEWKGGEMPVKEGARVLVLHRDGELHITEAGPTGCHAVYWDHDYSDGDIVAYRLAPRWQN